MPTRFVRNEGASSVQDLGGASDVIEGFGWMPKKALAPTPHRDSCELFRVYFASG